MSDLTNTFQIAAGTVMGRSHYHTRQNCQDAWWVERSAHSLAAVVCDGCGDPDSPCSEVGAALGSRLLAHHICEIAGKDIPLVAALEQARRRVVDRLGALAQSMGDLEDAVRRYFLFTVVGVLITDQEAAFFSLGDGLIGVNDRLQVIGPFPDNAPPYMAYALIPGHQAHACQFVVHEQVRISELKRFLLGTDGAAPLLDQSLTVPGTDEAAGGLAHWWEKDSLYHNYAALPNRLRLLGTDHQRIDWHARRKVIDRGRVNDDATLVIGRRVAGEEGTDGNA